MLTRCILARQIREGMRIVSDEVHFGKGVILEATYDAEPTREETVHVVWSDLLGGSEFAPDTKLRRVVN